MSEADYRKDVFFSYAHADKIHVEEIERLVEKEGFSCWIDTKNLRAGDEYNKEIFDAIENCTVFVVFFSAGYFSSEYCTKEYKCARDYGKPVVPLCLDTTDKYTDRNYAFVFNLTSGNTIFRYKEGIHGPDDYPVYAEEILHAHAMVQLKKYRMTGLEEDLPVLSASRTILQKLSQHVDSQMNAIGNYASNDCSASLYAVLKDEHKHTYAPDGTNAPLVSYVDHENFMETSGYLMMTGDGGIGKTVSMLQCARYLLKRQICAVYIPLGRLKEDQSIEEYIRTYVCTNNEGYYQDLIALLTDSDSFIQRSCLVLDGLNEYVSPAEFVRRQLYDLERRFPNTNLILTSRSYDETTMGSLRTKFTILNAQPLTQDHVSAYLRSRGITELPEKKTFSLLTTPLLVTLYADTEIHHSKYSQVTWIRMESSADTVGKLLWNYMQSQLYRASEEPGFQLAEHLILLEYYLPEVAFSMAASGRTGIENMDLVLLEADLQDAKKLAWYKAATLRTRTRTAASADFSSLLPAALHSLHLLKEDEEGTYSFTHQIFFAYFTAYAVYYELTLMNDQRTRKLIQPPHIAQIILPQESIELLSDLLHEEQAQPVQREEGFLFPGKNGCSPSSFSIAEQVLSLYRFRMGEDAQNAAANLFNIMKYGRRNNLACCDFSHLDLRKCSGTNVFFSTFDQNRMYTSNFDHAYIDCSFFNMQGHRSAITAVCFADDSRIYTADESGSVRLFLIREGNSEELVHAAGQSVRSLCFIQKRNTLLILTASVLYACRTDTKETTVLCTNRELYKKYKHVRYIQDEVQISYDTEPFDWYRTNNTLAESLVNDTIISGCTAYNPVKKQYAYSLYFQHLVIKNYDEQKQTWIMHPAVKEQCIKDHPGITFHRKNNVFYTDISLPEADFVMKGAVLEKKGNALSLIPPRENQYKILDHWDYVRNVVFSAYRFRYENKTEIPLPLRIYTADRSLSSAVKALAYSEDGNRLLVCVDYYLFELDTETLACMKQAVLPGAASCAVYHGRQIAVSIRNKLYILDESLNILHIFHGWSSGYIRNVIPAQDGSLYIRTDKAEIKKLNSSLTVESARRNSSLRNGSPALIQDRMNKEVQIGILYHNEMSVYSYIHDTVQSAGWRYRILQQAENIRFYVFPDRVELYPEGSEDKLVYYNHDGLYIAGCSFRGITGTLAENRTCMNILRQNGGRTDDTAQDPDQSSQHE